MKTLLVLLLCGIDALTISGPYYHLSTSTGATYTISGPPGTYRVPGQSMVPGLAPVNVTIVITIPEAGSEPGPGPGPGPGPEPNPPPPTPPVVTGKMWMIYVVDTNSAAYAVPGSFQSKLWSSNTIKSALAAAPISTFWWHFDSNSPYISGSDPKIKQTGWGVEAKKVGFPCIIAVDEVGHAISIPMPTDETGIISAAKKLRGIQ